MIKCTPLGQTMPRSKLLLPGLSSWCITLSMTTSPLTFPSWPLFFKSNAFALFGWLSNFRALVSHNSELQCYTQRSHQYMWQTFWNKGTVWFIKLPNNQIHCHSTLNINHLFWTFPSIFPSIYLSPSFSSTSQNPFWQKNLLCCFLQGFGSDVVAQICQKCPSIHWAWHIFQFFTKMVYCGFHVKYIYPNPCDHLI